MYCLSLKLKALRFFRNVTNFSGANATSQPRTLDSSTNRCENLKRRNSTSSVPINAADSLYNGCSFQCNFVLFAVPLSCCIPLSLPGYTQRPLSLCWSLQATASPETRCNYSVPGNAPCCLNLHNPLRYNSNAAFLTFLITSLSLSVT